MGDRKGESMTLTPDTERKLREYHKHNILGSADKFVAAITRLVAEPVREYDAAICDDVSDKWQQQAHHFQMQGAKQQETECRRLANVAQHCAAQIRALCEDVPGLAAGGEKES